MLSLSSSVESRPGAQEPNQYHCGGLWKVPCGVVLQEASDHVPHISDQFIVHTGNTDVAILLNKDTFELDPTVLAFRESSTSKGT